MKHISIFVTLVIFFALLLGSLNNNGVAAWFELDEKFIGKPTRTVLPDGRIHLKIETRENQPFPEGVKFPARVKTGSGHEDLNDVLQGSKEHYYSVRGEAIMQSHWEVFKLEDHTNADKLICHDRGDKNMRMSIFNPSDKLIDYLKNKKESIILHADANLHVCHNDPVFRVVSEAHFFNDEVLLVTAKAHYEHIFDEADIALDIKHPQLTHASNQFRYIHEQGNDHGVTPDNQPPADMSFGSKVVNEKMDRRNKDDNSEANGHKANRWEPELSAEAQARRGRAQGWFKKLCKAVSSAVTKVVTTVTQAVSNVVKAVATGIESAVKGVWNAITSFLQLNFDTDMDKSFDASQSYTKELLGLVFTTDFAFSAGFRFNLHIKAASLNMFHASVYGSLTFGAGAKLPKKTYSDDGQSKLWDIDITKITFVIVVVPVWISVSTRCLAAFSMNAGAEAEAGFRVTAAAELGVEYTPDRGFQMINNQEFKKEHSLTYAASLDASPSIAIQARFGLYSTVNAYAQLNLGLNLLITTMDEVCDLLKLTLDFFIQLSAGLDIELSILSFDIINKHFGPWTIANWKWPMLNVCKIKESSKDESRQLLALPQARSAAEQEHLTDLQANHHLLPQYHANGKPVLRDASVLSSDAILSLTTYDSGKVWTTDFSCPGVNHTDMSTVLTGFFQNDTTVFYVVLNRNISITPTVNSTLAYTLATQSFFAAVDSNVTRGRTYDLTILPADAQSAEMLGLDSSFIDRLIQSAGDNYTHPLNVTSLTITFDIADMNTVTVTSAAVCPTKQSNNVVTINNNATAPAAPVAGSYFGRMFGDFAKSLFPSFIRLITDVLVVVLILALIEFALAYFAPRFIGAEHWPKTAVTPRTREYVYAVAGVCVGILAMIVFVVGANLTFAEITGAQLAPNFTAPVSDKGDQSFLTASGVQTIVWKFHGASIELNKCPQYYPCSPDCRDLCVKQTRTWTNAPWPYCPSETSVQTEDGGCTKFAWDNILNAILFVVFLLVMPVVAIKKCDTIYRRLPVLHGSLMLAGMFLNLIWRRMDSFMREVEVQMFDPANKMINPFNLAMNADAEATWKTAVTLYWIMVGLVAVGSAYDIHLFRKDTLEGRMVKFDDTFEADGKSDYKKAMDNKPGNARPRGDTEFTRDVAADLANLGEPASVDPNELALM